MSELTELIPLPDVWTSMEAVERRLLEVAVALTLSRNGYEVVAVDRDMREVERVKDAVTLAVTLLEDAPYFNAGRGAVFNAEGVNELDASIMDGATLNAGAVAGVHNVRNPVLLARKVMTESVHVMLIGEGAMRFADHCGIAREPDSYFLTPDRVAQLEKARLDHRMMLDKAELGETLEAVRDLA